MAKYLDENGLLYFWQQIKTKFAGNAFSKVRVTNSGTNTDLEADTISDTLTLSNGNDITLTPTANTDTVQITHADSGVTAASKGDTANQTPSFGGTFKVTSGTVNARGHLTAFADHTVTIPNAVASSSSAGLMSAADKTRLDNLDGEYIELPANPANGNYLKYNGTAWVADDIPEGAAASSTTPKMDGTAAVGTENAFARGDHVHPTDTSRQAKITASGILKGDGTGAVSAVVSGTDIKTINGSSILGSGDLTIDTANTFIATVGTTTAAEVEAAITAGKAVFAYKADDSRLYSLTGETTTQYIFTATYYSSSHTYSAVRVLTKANNSWTSGSTNIALAPLGSPGFSGTPTTPTNSNPSDNSSQIASDSFVQSALTEKLLSYVTTTTAEATYAKKTDISGAYIYKGTVAAVADLPASGNTTGDVYNVTANDMNYAWDGSAWDPLGATFTITSITNAEIDAIVAT